MKTEETPPQPIDPSGWFVGACIFEGALILVAWLIAALIDVPLFSDFHWDGLDALKGVAAAIPPVFLFVVFVLTGAHRVDRGRGSDPVSFSAVVYSK